MAKLAVYARERGFLKDMPTLLCASLASVDGKLLEAVFPRVGDLAVAGDLWARLESEFKRLREAVACDC